MIDFFKKHLMLLVIVLCACQSIVAMDGSDEKFEEDLVKALEAGEEPAVSPCISPVPSRTASPDLPLAKKHQTTRGSLLHARRRAKKWRQQAQNKVPVMMLGKLPATPPARRGSAPTIGTKVTYVPYATPGTTPPNSPKNLVLK